MAESWRLGFSDKCRGLRDPWAFLNGQFSCIINLQWKQVRHGAVDGKQRHRTQVSQDTSSVAVVHSGDDCGCRACGKIGHLVADCPRKKAADTGRRENKEIREKEAQERQQRDKGRQGELLLRPHHDQARSLP